MRSVRRYLAVCFVGGLAAIAYCVSPVHAVEVLVNGGLEQGGGGPASWTLTSSVTGQPNTSVGATELRDQGNNPGPPNAPGIGLVVDSAAGDENSLSGQDLPVNVLLSQTTTVTAGKSYILQGDAQLQSSSSNFQSTLGTVIPGFDYNQDFSVDAADYITWRSTLGQSGTGLAADGDTNGVIEQNDYDLWKSNFGHVGHGPIPSPTTTTFKLEFLNGSGANATVLGTQTRDIRADTALPDVWQTHVLPQINAPAGATNARVTVSALNMVHACNQNCVGDRFVYLDNFSLVQQGAFGTDHLLNGNLNTPGAPAGFTITNSVSDNFQFSSSSFANVDTTLHPPAGVDGQHGIWLRAFQGGDFTISQTVPGIVGDQYTFSAWSKWELNFRGADSLSPTQDLLKIEFLNAANGVISSQTLDMRTVQINDNTWRQISMLAATAPELTLNIRVSAITTGMVAETGPLLSAFLDNFSLIQTGPGAGLAAAVPEPSSFALLGIALGIFGVWRRKG